MKISILFTFLTFTCLQSLSETLSWENSLKREMEYIQSQKSVLKLQLKGMHASFEKDISKLNNEINSLKAENTEIKETNSILSSQLEELKKWQNVKIDRISNKLSTLNSEVISLITQRKHELASMDPRNFDDLIPHLRTLKNNIVTLNTIDQRQTIIMKSSEGLESSAIIRIGPLLSFQSVPSEISNANQLASKSLVEAIQILIPTEFGFLKQADSKMITRINSQQNSYFITPGYFYDHFFKTHKFLKSKNLADKIADVLPAFFLLLVFACVGWIFLVLTKV